MTDTNKQLLWVKRKQQINEVHVSHSVRLQHKAKVIRVHEYVYVIARHELRFWEYGDILRVNVT